LDVEPLDIEPRDRRPRNRNASGGSINVPSSGTAMQITVRDIGVIDPDDPPPWL
jgi:hypothetical protein